ncbi:MAG TPA: ribulose-phosphate 3-epimerase [Clostridiales bacterium]|nr:ribulose-phosphate 3-epimerase [Clostridiales bacterium]
MEKKILISPSILSGDFVNMEKSVRLLSDWNADLVHCDVMDGVYVPNITFGMPMIRAIRKITDLPLDVHLMITKPEKYVEEFADAGADIITFHPEASENALETIKLIKSKGKKAGIVINAKVDIKPYLYLIDYIDMILIMSVNAGYGGQKFIPESLEKVKIAKEYIEKNKLNVDIEIDGGINEDNVSLVKNAGVNVIVAGSAVYKSSDPKKTIEILKK